MSTGTGLAPLRAFRGMLASDPFRTLQQRMNRLFDEALFTPPFEETISAFTWAPSCDVFETDNEIVLKAELPGLKKEDVHLTVENGVLMLRGERKFEEETKRENYHRIERSYGAFTRSFALPRGVDPSKVAAEFKDGVLRIALPKTAEAKTKEVEVRIK